MRAVLFFCIVLSFTLLATAQGTPRRTTAVKPKPSAAPVRRPAAADPALEKQHLEQALAAATPALKVTSLESFIRRYPSSTQLTRASESLTGARAALADEKYEAGETTAAVELFRKALRDAPKPYSDRFFREVIARIPANLYFRGSHADGLTAAKTIENSIATNAGQLVTLANFYLAIENGNEANRIADAALKLAPDSSAAYYLRGNANRMNFDLEASSAAYEKAFELDPTSAAAKRGLAEMKRALGKPGEAVDLYSELLDKNSNDHQARTGLIMALFNAGKRQEAETEMAKAVELGTGNVVLTSSAAYWYATQSDGARAVELGRQAIAAEPRYIWGHLALARGLMIQGNPLEAERVLTNARKYGNFPTLEYEIANARMMNGFYREAAEELAKSFIVVPGGVETRLGGRIARREKTLADLVAFERRASIFEPGSPDKLETSERMRSLLEFHQKLGAAPTDEEALAAAADSFVNGDDSMKLHRQLFAASALVEKRAAIGKALEFTKAATGRTDTAIAAPNAAAAVMANELYESRGLAFSRGEFIIIPDIPKQTLSAILRGRIEEITGWALFYQNNYPEAAIRLRRAVSVYPEKSAWWRSGTWRLGASLEAQGKDREALDSYVSSYKIDRPDAIRYAVIENLYRKVHGNVEGLEAAVGAKPVSMATLAATPISQTPEPSVTALPAPPVTAGATPVAQVAPPSPATDSAIDKKTKPTRSPDVPAAVNAEPPKLEPVVEPKLETVVTAPEPAPPENEKRADVSTRTESTPSLPVVKIEPPASDTTQTPTSVPIAPPETALAEKPAKALPELKKTEATSIPESTKPAAKRPLFDPIIITIPARSDAAKPVDGTPTSGEQAKVPCTVVVSDKNVSVENDGGTVSIAVSLKDADIGTDVTATTDSPENIDVKRDTTAAETGARRFFTIKSISAATGTYKVTFAASCGTAVVEVRVR